MTRSILINVKAPLLQVHVFCIIALLLLFYTLNDVSITTSAQALTHPILPVLKVSNTTSAQALMHPCPPVTSAPCVPVLNESNTTSNAPTRLFNASTGFLNAPPPPLFEVRQPQSTTVVVSLQTDNVRYVTGTPIRVSGEVINGTSGLVKQSIAIIISTHDMQRNATVSSVATLAKNGFYDASLPPISVAGNYRIYAYVPSELLNFPYTSTYSSLSIEIQELFYTRTAIMLYVGGGGSLIGLIFVILKAPREEKKHLDLLELSKMIRFMRWTLNPITYAVLRFIFLSTIALTTMTAFALTDVQIAPISPLGLVIKATGSNNTQTGNQWVLNIGGVATNNYSAGVQVPVSVIIFGIAGGYLRFLYFTSTKEREEKPQDEPFYESLKDLALFFLSPLLAVAVWLVLFQGGTTSIFTLAAVSFTVGLVTREVVEALIRFVISKVSPQASDEIHGNGQKQSPANTEEGKKASKDK